MQLIELDYRLENRVVAKQPTRWGLQKAGRRFSPSGGTNYVRSPVRPSVKFQDFPNGDCIMCLEPKEEVALIIPTDTVYVEEMDKPLPVHAKHKDDVQEIQSINGGGVGCNGGTPKKEPQTSKSC